MGRKAVDIVYRSALSGKSALRFPPVLSPVQGIDAVRPLLQDRPSVHSKYPVVKGACACSSFLHSRSLSCMYTVLVTSPCVIDDGTAANELLYLSVVERPRTAPFWVVPSCLLRLAKELKNGGRIDDVVEVLGRTSKTSRGRQRRLDRFPVSGRVWRWIRR
jgi:hypothetical protein